MSAKFNDVLFNLVSKTPSTACVVGAVYLLAHGVDTGWGWLLLCAVILFTWVTTDSDKKKDADDT